MEKFVNTNIQYEENIFYLKLALNSIKKAPLLNINKELFQKKIKDDLLFIKKCTKILYDKLLGNTKLITRDKLLHDILNLKDLYVQILNDLNKAGYIKINDFQESLNKNKEDINYINSILINHTQNDHKEDLTTNEELNILLMENDDKEDE